MSQVIGKYELEDWGRCGVGIGVLFAAFIISSVIKTVVTDFITHTTFSWGDSTNAIACPSNSHALSLSPGVHL